MHLRFASLAKGDSKGVTHRGCMRKDKTGNRKRRSVRLIDPFFGKPPFFFIISKWRGFNLLTNLKTNRVQDRAIM